jgi:type II restriction/modification system DNA methylase subunit YeeA
VRYEPGTFIYRLAGRDREKSASYYTPEVLTKSLVKYALKELLADKSADEILGITICEPAMGSAAFLNEAINQLSEAYLQKKQLESGERIPHDRYILERQKVKMHLADNNVFGVDLNPTAVELAEISLWLNALFADEHETFIP